MSESEETKREEASQPAAKRPMEKRKRLGITLGCIAVVLVVAGAGFMVWHEQPSFCNAICHDPMDPYLPTFEATPGQPATDKWGNEVEDASSMLAAVHNQAGKTCMDCHVPQLDEQMTEGAEWVTGNYDSPLGERTSTQLVEARGLENSDEFCMNTSCHPYGRDELVKKTAWMGKINPHTPQHGEQKCTTCHKAHRASVNYCTQCHTDAVVPDGWLSYTDSKLLEEAAGITDEQ
ncbi:cytochrome c3 family protein [Senegalimassilia anaerobia]|uniref:cytochrome c-type protein Cgr1 n=1 Tax=Senegalimassilia anaerobia TaxID=1473216 RepID=UPI00026D2F5F|nr:cytochrome c3 family protein [Senegalimassilia anaerobia]